MSNNSGFPCVGVTFNIDTLNKQDVACDREGQHLFVNKF